MQKDIQKEHAIQKVRMPNIKFVYTSRSVSKKRILYTFLVLGGVFTVLAIAGYVWLHKNIISQLPKIDVNNFYKLSQLAQGSIVTDRKGVVLYKFFEENREYIPFSGFSPHVINAAIATEDNTFWTNPGLDYTSLIRAAVYRAIGKNTTPNQRGFGASTISQQLVRNILLTREKTSIRRIKEIFLTLKLNSIIEKYLKKKYKNLSNDKLQRKKKEMIMELYLNLVFLGNGTYGVEAAAEMYFNKQAKDLTILESAILAGIIQAPSRYNPYTNKIGNPNCNNDMCQGVVGGLVVKNQGKVIENLTGDLQKIIIQKVSDLIRQADLSSIKDNKALMGFLNGLLTTTVTYQDKIYTIAYQWGRKDTVLTRMYKEGFITQDELKQALIEGLTIEFSQKKITIKAPHFVFRIRDLLLSDPSFSHLGINADILMKGGLKITTTLDYHIQEIAEKALRDNQHIAAAQGAHNSSFIYIDSKVGDVLAYVGSVDYENEKIKGKIDMLREPRQPGSSIKPLIYAFGFQTIPLSLDTPIYDIPMKIGANTPNNWDFKFPGLLPVREALARSRNIPAIKMYFAVGEEEKLKPYLQKLGLKHLKTDHDYGYSMALGAGEVPALEMAQAYAHIGTLGEPALINPILEIRGPDGKIIYKKKVQKAERVLEKGPAYLVRKILSDPANMPPGRAAAMKPRVRFKNGMKSGTSNMVDAKGKTRSRDATLALITPSKVAFGWVGNADASPHEAYGRSLNGVFKQFFETLEKENYIQQEDHPQPYDVRSLVINKISGRPAASTTPEPFKVSTLARAKTMPGGEDIIMEPIDFDKLCGGLVSPYTPAEDIVHGYVIKPVSFIPSQRDLQDIINWYKGALKATGTGEKITYNYPNILVEAPTKPCEERIPKEDTSIVISLSQPQENQQVGITSIPLSLSVLTQNKPIQRLVVFLDDVMIATQGVEKTKKLLGYTFSVPVPKEKQIPGNHILKVTAVDTEGYANTLERPITLVADTTPPKLDPTSIHITQKEGKYVVTLRFVDDMSTVDKVRIILDSGVSKGFSSNEVSFTVERLGSVGYIVVDAAGNQTGGTIRLDEYFSSQQQEGQTQVENTQTQHEQTQSE